MDREDQPDLALIIARTYLMDELEVLDCYKDIRELLHPLELENESLNQLLTNEKNKYEDIKTQLDEKNEEIEQLNKPIYKRLWQSLVKRINKK